jgi:phenylacetate-CoA ligase
MTRRPFPLEFRTELPELAFPASVGRQASDLLALLYQLERTEWWPPDELRRRQLEQFGALARHASRQSGFHAERFARAGIFADEPWDDARFSTLPLLTRSDLLQHAAAIHCRRVPKAHGTVTSTQTSGSTGQPVTVRRTAKNFLMWSALNLRDHVWHQRDFSKTLAVIRPRIAARATDEASPDGWGHPTSILFNTGPCFRLPIDTDLSVQIDWLIRHDPEYLLTYPTNLSGLITRFETAGARLGRLRQVRTMGETVPAELRERCRNVLGARLIDSYSSEEVGAIALECPESGLYHVHAESLIVEVLDPTGHPVGPGKIGRVVVTDLQNFATPLIRYELRDHAEVGLACPCGRGLPTLSRILGRRRNMVVLPTGERYWPLVGFYRYRAIADVLQYQLVQHSLDEVEMRIATPTGALSQSQEQQLARIVQESLHHPFRVRFSCFEGELPRAAAGKFEEFVSYVD